MSNLEWPREIWAAELEEHEPVGRHVFSEFATVARFDGDTEREREFHRYVDGDIFDSQERYFRTMLENERAAFERKMVAIRKAAKSRDLLAVHAITFEHPSLPDNLTVIEDVTKQEDEK